jgi:hypothetical protein
MTFKRVACASTLAAGVGLAGLFGVGLGTASADPGPGCNAPGQPPCGQDHNGNNGNNGHDNGHDGHDNGNNNGPGNWNNGPGNGPNNGPDNGPGNWNNGPGNGGQPDWHGRGVDQGRQDHQPFNWNGQQVNPVQAANGAGWGFWFLGMWIPL